MKMQYAGFSVRPQRADSAFHAVCAESWIYGKIATTQAGVVPKKNILTLHWFSLIWSTLALVNFHKALVMNPETRPFLEGLATKLLFWVRSPTFFETLVRTVRGKFAKSKIFPWFLDIYRWTRPYVHSDGPAGVLELASKPVHSDGYKNACILQRGFVTIVACFGHTCSPFW